MRIAVASDDNLSIDGVVSSHFGRCSHYTIVDVDGTEMKSAKVIDSPFYGGHGQSGEVPNFIHSQGVNVMITGGMGPKAIGFFNEFGIEVVTGASGRVRDALSSYLGGMLSGSESCRESERTPEKVESGDDKLSRLRKEAEFL